MIVHVYIIEMEVKFPVTMRNFSSDFRLQLRKFFHIILLFIFFSLNIVKQMTFKMTNKLIYYFAQKTTKTIHVHL